MCHYLFIFIFNAPETIVQNFFFFTNVKVYNLQNYNNSIFFKFIPVIKKKKSKFFYSLQLINILLIGP